MEKDNQSPKMGVSYTSALSKLFRTIRLDNKDVLAVYFFAIFSGIVFLSLPLGIQSIIGFVMAGSVSTSIIVLIVLVLLGVIINGLLQVRQMEHIEKIEQKIYVRYAFEFSHKLLSLDLDKARKYHLPELVNRFLEVSSLQKSLQKLLIDIPAALVQIIFGTILLSFYHPLFLGFGLIMLTIVLLILRFTASQGLTSAVNTSDAKYALTSWFQDLSAAILDFKAETYGDWHMNRTDQLVSDYLKHRTRHFRVLKFQYWSLIAFKISIIAIMLILGVVLLVDQQINIGQFIAADLVIITIINSVEKFIGNFDKVYNAMVALEKLEKVVGLPEEVAGNFERHSSELPTAHSLTPFENAEGQWNLEAGQWSCWITPTAYLSRQMPMITGLIEMKEGHALIDGLPTTSFKPSPLRQGIGWMGKNSGLFHGSILENITMGNEPSDPEQLMQLAHLTGLMKAIARFKNGFDTQLGPRGHKADGPLKHAILLTRAMLGNKVLILLEDPFHHLSDEEVLRLLNYLKRKELTLVVSVPEADNRIKQMFDQVITLNY
ncbi:MAG: ABC transporter ATP-binding protein [Saprospiraceae bacterium]|nr:ABC transporter ATP-binding protein [Saprospiraceae bacterium]